MKLLQKSLFNIWTLHQQHSFLPFIENEIMIHKGKETKSLDNKKQIFLLL